MITASYKVKAQEKTFSFQFLNVYTLVNQSFVQFSACVMVKLPWGDLFVLTQIKTEDVIIKVGNLRKL